MSHEMSHVPSFHIRGHNRAHVADGVFQLRPFEDDLFSAVEGIVNDLELRHDQMSQRSS